MKLRAMVVVACGVCACRRELRTWEPLIRTAACEVRIAGEGGLRGVAYYDPAGRLVSGSRASGDGAVVSERFDYDPRGRLVAIDSHEERAPRDGACDVIAGCREPALRAIDRVDLTWDGARLRDRQHRRVEYELQDGHFVEVRRTRDTVAYGYTAGKLSAVDAGAFRRTISYDAAGQPIRERVEQRGQPARDHAITTVGDRVVRRESLGQIYVFDYDAQGRVVRRDTTGAGDLEISERWDYGAGGAVTGYHEVQADRRGGARDRHDLDLRYDEAGRLIEVVAQRAPRERVTYDGACQAVRRGPRPPDPMGQDGCVNSPHEVLQACWW